MKVIILGAGISGISAGYHLKQKGFENIIYEKSPNFGGLCGSFEKSGFTFDKFIHMSFTKSEYVQNLFKKSSEYYVHKPDAMNYYYGTWLKHPAQNNIKPLSTPEKINIIKDFIKRPEKEIKEISNYEEWLRNQYGDFFAENFPMEYTKKYWTVEAKHLETKWIGQRMYKPTIEEVLEGAFTNNVPNKYYAKEMRYPVEGGYKSFLRKMTDSLKIENNKEVVKIFPREKKYYLKMEKKKHMIC